ncbi:MAG: lipoate--protein ligase family protein [Nitrospirae bacterium]|nr:lipoate--protein ligase family protein [Nitrospirota bacterium]MBF0592085.1 lipoate--protein ligase family protein [Nitrospirota bacterium]
MEQWRLIPYGKNDAFCNMAIDEAIACCVNDGLSPPTLRFYGWLLPSVSIGAFQGSNCIDHQWCAQRGVAVVRRPTGGRAVVHDDELTYSFTANLDNGFFTKSVLNNHKMVNSVFYRALRRLGLEVDFTEGRLDRRGLLSKSLCFASTSYGEVSAGGKKVIGAAQRRYANGFIEQGSMPLSVDRELVAGALRVNDTLPSDCKERSEDILAGLTAISDSVEISNIIDTVRDCFEESFGVTLNPAALTPQEDRLTQQLLLKYRSEGWTHRR